MERIALLGLLVLALGAAGCSGAAGCAQDGDCPARGSLCDRASRQCVCPGGQPCPEAMAFCNAAGSCQALRGCQRNEECPAGTFCDATEGRCLEGPAEAPGGLCGASTHCAFGFVCMGGRCHEGCHDDGDCRLGEMCLEHRCRGAPGECGHEGFCAFGEACVDGVCQRDDRGPYCAPCRPTQSPEPPACGDARSFCLLNSYGGGPDLFCGVTCARGEPCPSGYTCAPVAMLTDRLCAADDDCPRPGQRCLLGESRTEGVCSCLSSDDCATDTCDPGRGSCRLSGVPCGEAAPCPPIPCEHGACLLGWNCVPREGLSCEDLTAPR